MAQQLNRSRYSIQAEDKELVLINYLFPFFFLLLMKLTVHIYITKDF